MKKYMEKINFGGEEIKSNNNEILEAGCWGCTACVICFACASCALCVVPALGQAVVITAAETIIASATAMAVASTNG